MHSNEPIRVVGYDAHSVPRVWAEDAYEQTAYGFAREEALAYIRRRPDTGPLSAWRFEAEGDDEANPTDTYA